MAAVWMLGFGLLLFLALVSYTPKDVPDSLWYSTISSSEPKTASSNFIGPVGAIFAGFTFFFFGAASYLIPTAMLWFGLGRFFFEAKMSKRSLIGFVVFVLSGACVLHFQPIFFQKWHDTYNIPGPGGGVGFMLADYVFSVFGSFGGFLLALLIYLTGMVMVTGFHPRHFAKLCKEGIVEWMEEREARKMEESTEAERLEKQRQKLEKERIRLEKQLAAEEKKLGKKVRPKAAPEADEDDETVDEVDSSDADEDTDVEGGHSTPEPKIIDSSERRPASSSKPSLKEVLQRNREKNGTSDDGHSLLNGEIAFPDYELPDVDLLDEDEEDAQPADKNLLIQTQNVIIETLGSFGIKVTAGDITRGPTITRYEIYPSPGLRVSRITQVEADIARATKAERINILAPIPGKDTVGIEIANNEKMAVRLRELLEDPAFTDSDHRIPLALGKDVYGNAIIGDLARMPHLLVAGATGSGKSVCINSIIASILFRFTPDELRFIMVDPKVVEMQMYNSLPHLIVPVVTDPKKVLTALRWVVNEMERRYRIFAEVNVRNFEGFNGRKKHEADKAAAASAKTKKGKTTKTSDHPELDLFGDTSDTIDELEATIIPDVEETDAETEANGEEWEYVYEYVDEEGNPIEAPENKEGEEGEWEYEYVDANGSDEDVPWEEGEDAEDDSDVIPAVSSKQLLSAHPGHISNAQIAPSVTTSDLTDAAPAEDSDDDYQDPDKEKIPERFPYIVVIVDELADLMQTAPADMEGLIARIAQKARAAGIHLIIATQTPRADVVTGIIKANIPSRIAFQVSSALDSRVILDSKGAEKLVGKGDMLYLPPGASQLSRAQGALISDDETMELVQRCAAQGTARFEPDIEESLSGNSDSDEEISDEDEECVEKCIEVIEQERRASTSLLQRRLRLGYTRAARMMDILEMRGIIGPGDGAKPREILVDFSED